MESQRTSVFLAEFLADPKNDVQYGRFAAKFGPWIKERCQGLKLQEADAEDLTAAILLGFFQRNVFDGFVFQGKEKFRGWLNTVTRHAVLTFLRDRGRRPDAWSVGNPDAQDAVLRAADEMGPELELVCKELRSRVEAAYTSVQPRVHETTWQAFHLVTEANLSVEEVTERLGMHPPAVWKALSRVRRMLREELKDWLDPDSDHAVKAP